MKLLVDFFFLRPTFSLCTFWWGSLGVTAKAYVGLFCGLKRARSQYSCGEEVGLRGELPLSYAYPLHAAMSTEGEQHDKHNNVQPQLTREKPEEELKRERAKVASSDASWEGCMGKRQRGTTMERLRDRVRERDECIWHRKTQRKWGFIKHHTPADQLELWKHSLGSSMQSEGCHAAGSRGGLGNWDVGMQVTGGLTEMDTQLQWAELKTGNKCEHKTWSLSSSSSFAQRNKKEEVSPVQRCIQANLDVSGVSKNTCAWTVNIS